MWRLCIAIAVHVHIMLCADVLLQVYIAEENGDSTPQYLEDLIVLS